MVSYHGWALLLSPSQGSGASPVPEYPCRGPCHAPSPASKQGTRGKQGWDGAGQGRWLSGAVAWMRNVLCSRTELGCCQFPHVSRACCRETTQGNILSSASCSPRESLVWDFPQANSRRSLQVSSLLALEGLYPGMTKKRWIVLHICPWG